MAKAKHLRIKKSNFDKVCAAALAGGMALSVMSPTAFAMEYNAADGTVHVSVSENESVLSWQDNNADHYDKDTAYNHTEEKDNVIEITGSGDSEDPTDDEIIIIGDGVTGVVDEDGDGVNDSLDVSINDVNVAGTEGAAIQIGDDADVDLTIKDTTIKEAKDDGINIGNGSTVDITFEGDNYFSGTGSENNTSGIQVGSSGDTGSEATGEDSTVTITGTTGEDGSGASFTVENASNGVYIGKNDSVTIDGGNGGDGTKDGNLDITINGTTGTTDPDSSTSDRAILNYGDLTVTGGADVSIKEGNIGINTYVDGDTDKDSGFVKITGDETDVSISNVTGQHGVGIYMESYDDGRTAELEISDGASVLIQDAKSRGIVGDNTTVTVNDAELNITGGQYGVSVATRKDANNSADFTITGGAEVTIEGTSSAGIYAESYNDNRATNVTVESSNLTLDIKSGHGISGDDTNVIITGDSMVSSTGGQMGIAIHTRDTANYSTKMEISNGARVIIKNTSASGLYSENYNKNHENQIVIDGEETAVEIDGTVQAIGTSNTDITITKAKVDIKKARMLGISIATSADRNYAADLTISGAQVSMESTGWGGIYTENVNQTKANKITMQEDAQVEIRGGGILGGNTDITVNKAKLTVRNAGISMGTDADGYGNTIAILNGAQVDIENEDGKGVSMTAFKNHKDHILVDGATLNVTKAKYGIVASSTDVTFKGGAEVVLKEIGANGVELSTSPESIKDNTLRIHEDAVLTVEGAADNADGSGIALGKDKSAYIYDGAAVTVKGKDDAVLAQGKNLIVEDATLASNDGVIELCGGDVHFEIRNKSKVVASAVLNTTEVKSGTPEFVIVGGTMTLTGMDKGLNANHSQKLYDPKYEYKEDEEGEENEKYVEYLIWPTNGEAYGNEKLVNFVLTADGDHCTIRTYGWGSDGKIAYEAKNVDALGALYEDWYLCDLAKEGETLSVWVPAVVLDYYYKDQLPKDTSFRGMTEKKVYELLGGTLFNGKQDAIIRGESINFGTLSGEYTSGNTQTDKIWYYFDEKGNLQPFNADTRIYAQNLQNIYAMDTVKPTTPSDPSTPSAPIIPIVKPETPEAPAAPVEVVTETAAPVEEIAAEQPQVKLPQTGQNWALAGLLAIAGGLMAAIGITPRKHRKDEHEV